MATRSQPRSAQQEQRGARKSCGKNESTEEIAQLVRSQIVSYLRREFLVPRRAACQPVVAATVPTTCSRHEFWSRGRNPPVSASCRDLQAGSLCSPQKAQLPQLL